VDSRHPPMLRALARTRWWRADCAHLRVSLRGTLSARKKKTRAYLKLMAAIQLRKGSGHKSHPSQGAHSSPAGCSGAARVCVLADVAVAWVLYVLCLLTDPCAACQTHHHHHEHQHQHHKHSVARVPDPEPLRGTGGAGRLPHRHGTRASTVPERLRGEILGYTGEMKNRREISVSSDCDRSPYLHPHPYASGGGGAWAGRGRPDILRLPASLGWWLRCAVWW
jgi:hypothetical protein